jgi:hypothetical protein
MVLKRPTALFIDEALVHDEGWFQVWQQLDVMGIRLNGVIDDRHSTAWRTWLDEYFRRDGWPRGLVADLRTTISSASLPRRLQTAQWIHTICGSITCCSALIGDHAVTNLTLRAALRIAGRSNIVVRHDIEHFALDVSDLLSGHTPPATRSDAAWA